MAEGASEKGAGGRVEKKNRTAEMCTAIHVVKGAIVKVFNTPLTTAVTFNAKTKGRIAVQYEGPAPSDAQVKEVEVLANKLIADNVPVKMIKMNRAEAEAKFKAQPVNGTFIYDKYASLPPEITELGLVLIDDWNVNGCPGHHLSSTGQLGQIKILRTNHRPNKQELEFCIDLLPPGSTPSGDSAPGKAKKTKGAATLASAASSSQAQDYADVGKLSVTIFDEFMHKLEQELAGDDAAIAAIKGKEEALRKDVTERLANTLAIMRNTAYTSGFSARLPAGTHS